METTFIMYGWRIPDYFDVQMSLGGSFFYILLSLLVYLVFWGMGGSEGSIGKAGLVTSCLKFA